MRRKRDTYEAQCDKTVEVPLEFVTDINHKVNAIGLV